MHVKELGLSAAAVGWLETGGVNTVAQLTAIPAQDLLDRRMTQAELYRVITCLNDAGLSLPPIRDGHVRPPGRREREMLRLRLIEMLTLKQIGVRTGVSTERVRQHLRMHFGLTGRRR